MASLHEIPFDQLSGRVPQKIPKLIHQSWKTKKLDSSLQKAVDTIKKLNPEYQYTLYDDQDCRNFLDHHFGLDLVEAFDDVIPGAFKCDLWRYAMLYIKGGVYIDIDLKELVPLRDIIFPFDQLVSVVDRKIFPDTPKCAIYQAFIACVPGHPVMLKALLRSYENIKKRKEVYYLTLFDITGPVVMGRALNDYLGNGELEDILPGERGKGIRLYQFENSGKYIVRGEGNSKGPIFSTQVEGYSPEDHYVKVKTFYRPQKGKEKSGNGTLVLVLTVLVVLTLWVSKGR